MSSSHYSISGLISCHPMSRHLHVAHEAILRNMPRAEVPIQYFAFMSQYRDAYRHHTELFPPSTGYVRDFEPPKGKEILWFSGGSDSVLLSTLLPHAKKIKGSDFYSIPDYRFKQEFQLALAGAVLRAPTIYIGTNASDSDYGKNGEKWDYENNKLFANLWSSYFKSQLRYPLAEQKLDKVDVYTLLRDRGLLSKLNHCKKSPPCWACFDCVLHHFLLCGLDTKIKHPKPDPKVVKKALKYTRDSVLKGTYDDPHFVKALVKLNNLYGYRPHGVSNAIYS